MPSVLSIWYSFAVACFVRFDRLFRRLLFPARTSIWSGLVQDLPRSKSEPILENALLRHQLAILQRQSKPPHFTSADRFWFLALASRLKDWKDALVLLQPETLLRWHRAGFHLFWKHKSKPKTTQPKIAVETIALIQQMATENPLWGAERLRGELLKLGIHVAKDTIQTYLCRIRPVKSPSQNWNTFLKNHAHEVWACDFLPVIDLCFRTVYVFFIIELDSRRVVHFGVTRHPTDAWVAQQLREATPEGQTPRFLIRDNDRKYGAAFTRLAIASGIEVLRTPYRAPRANALCERFLGSVRRECLDPLLIWNEGQLRRVVQEDVTFFNAARPHQGIKQKIPEQLKVNEEPKRTGKIIAFPVLNGLHHDYRRAA